MIQFFKPNVVVCALGCCVLLFGCAAPVLKEVSVEGVQASIGKPINAHVKIAFPPDLKSRTRSGGTLLGSWTLEEGRYLQIIANRMLPYAFELASELLPPEQADFMVVVDGNHSNCVNAEVSL